MRGALRRGTVLRKFGTGDMRLKRIRIGCGAGGCSFERLEPADELITKGDIDYIVFECLAERTIAAAQRDKLADPEKGYNPMLEERMRRILPLIKKHHVRIVSNMGAANTPVAVRKIVEIAGELGVTGLKIAMVTGDDLSADIEKYQDAILMDAKEPLKTLGDTVVSANVYLSCDCIKDALDAGADIVITGRIADPSLFVGILRHEFGWTIEHPGKIGQSILLGHLMECAGQLTGGFYADPGYKDCENLHLLGFPIAEMDETGRFFVTKVEGSGGAVTEQICKEQLLYEIGDPANYITPDGIADFSRVTFEQIGKDRVEAKNAVAKGLPETFKVNIGYQNCYIGEAEISYGGSNCLNRARLAAEIVKGRIDYIGITPDEYRVDFIGYNSLYRDSISAPMFTGDASEVRLRISARAADMDTVSKVVREVDCLYTNGPAGSAGIASHVSRVLSVENILIPKADVRYEVTYVEA